MKFAVTFLVFACVFAFVACGDKSPAPAVDEPAEINPAAARSKKYKIKCEDENACSPEVGILFAINSQGLIRCGQSVVGEFEGKSVIATNKHCVEGVSDLRTGLVVRYPKTSRLPEETAGFGRLLRISEFKLGRYDLEAKRVIPDRVPDYAFIQLDRKLNRPAARVSQRGLPYGSAVTTQYFDDSTTADEFVLKRVACQTTSAESVGTDVYKSARSAVVTLFGCMIKGGNSGSPVYDEKGEIAALLQIGTIDDGSVTKMKNKFSGLGYDIADFDPLKFGAATNLACVSLPEAGLNAPADAQSCRVSIDGRKLRETDPNDSRLKLTLYRATLKAILETHRSDTDKIFLWQVQTADEPKDYFYKIGYVPPMAMEIVPKCFYPLDGNLRRYHKREYLGIVDQWQGSASLSYEVPAIAMRVKMTATGEVQPVLQEFRYSGRAEFSPDDLSRLRDGEKAVVNYGVEGHPRVLRLGFCPADEVKEDDPAEIAALEKAIAGDDATLAAYIKRETEKAQAKAKKSGAP